MPKRERKELKNYARRVIVAGSRGYSDYKSFSSLLADFIMFNDISKVDTIFLSGAARSGADAMIIKWCEENGWDYIEYPAAWDAIEGKDKIIRTNKNGIKYNVNAGFERNTAMARDATCLVAYWNGNSPGTSHMLKTGNKHNLQIHHIKIK